LKTVLPTETGTTRIAMHMEQIVCKERVNECTNNQRSFDNTVHPVC